VTESPFSHRGLVIVIGLLCVSFVALLVWSVFGGEIKPTDSVDSDSYSRSALGHHAFVSLLRELGIETLVSRNESGARAGDGAVLLVAEPTLDSQLRETEFRRQVDRAARTLVVLPKWHGVEDSEHPGWIREVWPVAESTVTKPLRTLGCMAEVVRLGDGEQVTWDADIAPRLPRAQLLAPDGITPLISCAQGVLLGLLRRDERLVFILSDPDLLANHGLAHIANAQAALHVLGRVRGVQSRPVVVDETLHGFGRGHSAYRALFDFPLMLATMHGMLLLVVLLWAAMGRFGPPEPVDPALGFGKDVLMDNTATLLAAGRHSGPALTRYLGFAAAEARHDLRAPAGLAGEGLDTWLDRVAGSRGIEPPMSVLRQRVVSIAGSRGVPPAREVLATARTIHRWKEEMIRGHRHDS